MALKDITSRGRVLAGAFNKPGIPIVGKTNLWETVGFFNLTKPSKEGESWVLMLAAMRSDQKGVTIPVPLPEGLTIPEMIARIGTGMNALMTYRDCSCPEGRRCANHEFVQSPNDGDAQVSPDDTPIVTEH